MKRQSHSNGVSITEVLIALAIFSLAVVGLFLAMGAINRTIATSMRRDIEGAYANMLISRINPYDQAVETAYDVTSTGCSGARCYIDIPNSYNPSRGTPTYDRAYYTLLVNSNASATTANPASADVKAINLYLYRNATTTSPYRQFKREIAPDVSAWTMGGTNSFYRDITGLLWTRISTSTNYNTTLGSVTAGMDTTDTPNGVSVVTTATVPTNIPTVDQALWMSAIEPPSGTKFCFDFPATANRPYVVELGFNEFDTNVTASSQRVFDIYLNDNVAESSVDIYDAAGGRNKSVTKSYSVTPTLVGANQVPTIKIKLQQNGGVTARRPRVSWIRIRRD